MSPQHDFEDILFHYAGGDISSLKQPCGRRASDAECLAEFLLTNNSVTRAVAFDIVVKRLKLIRGY